MRVRVEFDADGTQRTVFEAERISVQVLKKGRAAVRLYKDEKVVRCIIFRKVYWTDSIYDLDYDSGGVGC